MARMPRSFASAPRKFFHSHTATTKRGCARFDGHHHGAVEVNHGADVAGGIFVGGNGLIDRGFDLVGGNRQVAESDDMSGIEQALDVLVHAEDGGAVIGGVAANAFEDAEAELHSGADKWDHAFAGGSQRIVDPDVTGGGHIDPC